MRLAGLPIIRANADSPVITSDMVRRAEPSVPAPTTAGTIDNPLVPHHRLVGHRQVTDAHLLAIARVHDASVVSFDQGMKSLGDSSVKLLAI